MSNLEKQLINYYSNENKNKIECEIKKCYNYKYGEINVFTGKKYNITNIETNIVKSCIFDSLCNYNHDGILITDEGDILVFVPGTGDGPLGCQLLQQKINNLQDDYLILETKIIRLEIENIELENENFNLEKENYDLQNLIEITP